MTNRIKLSELSNALAYSNEQVECINKMLSNGNEAHTGEEIWERLNAGGYVIIPTQLLLQSILRLESLIGKHVKPDPNN